MTKDVTKIIIFIFSILVFCVLAYVIKKNQELNIDKNVLENKLMALKENIAAESMKSIDYETKSLESFKEKYSWLGEKTYEKVTLTNQDNYCLDITDNVIWNNYFIKEYTFESNVFKHILSPKASNTYIYIHFIFKMM